MINFTFDNLLAADCELRVLESVEVADECSSSWSAAPLELFLAPADPGPALNLFISLLVVVVVVAADA